jgi:hypothetical protein
MTILTSKLSGGGGREACLSQKTELLLHKACQRGGRDLSLCSSLKRRALQKRGKSLMLLAAGAAIRKRGKGSLSEDRETPLFSSPEGGRDLSLRTKPGTKRENHVLMERQDPSFHPCTKIRRERRKEERRKTNRQSVPPTLFVVHFSIAHPFL